MWTADSEYRISAPCLPANGKMTTKTDNLRAPDSISRRIIMLASILGRVSFPGVAQWQSVGGLNTPRSRWFESSSRAHSQDHLPTSVSRRLSRRAGELNHRQTPSGVGFLSEARTSEPSFGDQGPLGRRTPPQGRQPGSVNFRVHTPASQPGVIRAGIYFGGRS